MAGTAVYVRHSRHTPVGRYLLLMLVGASGYTFASGAHVFVSDPTVAHIVHNGVYASGALLTAAGTLMVIAFTDREGLQRRWFVGLLCAFVLVDVVAAVTDPWVGAFMSDPVFVQGAAIARTTEHTGPYFWVRNSALYLLALLSLLLILVKLSDANGIYRRQLSLVAAGQTFVITMFLVQVVVPNVPGFDLASVGLFGGTLTIAVAVREWEFGRVVPDRAQNADGQHRRRSGRTQSRRSTHQCQPLGVGTARTPAVVGRNAARRVSPARGGGGRSVRRRRPR
jgi:hypothetical protein